MQTGDVIQPLKSENLRHSEDSLILKEKLLLYGPSTNKESKINQNLQS